MTFEEMLDQALAMLQRRGRVTYRALTLQFRLDDDHLEALKDEPLRPPTRRRGRRPCLIWTGETRLTPTPASPPALDQERAPPSYTPAHLTKILEARPSLEGERNELPSCSLISRAPWSCWPTATRRKPGASSIPSSHA